MLMTMRATVLLLVLPVGAIVLEILLSRTQSRWPGLLLPALTFLYSVLAVLSYAVYDGMGLWKIFAGLLGTFLLCNIPTLILIAVYAACREKRRRRVRLEKMEIQDL